MRSVSEGYPLEKRLEVELDAQFETMLTSLKTPYSITLPQQDDDADTDIGDDDSLYPISNGNGADVDSAAVVVSWVLDALLDLTAKLAADSATDEQANAKRSVEATLAAAREKQHQWVADVAQQADAQMALALVIGGDDDASATPTAKMRSVRARSMALDSCRIAKQDEADALAVGVSPRNYSIKNTPKRGYAARTPLSSFNISIPAIIDEDLDGPALPAAPPPSVASYSGYCQHQTDTVSDYGEDGPLPALLMEAASPVLSSAQHKRVSMMDELKITINKRASLLVDGMT